MGAGAGGGVLPVKQAAQQFQGLVGNYPGQQYGTTTGPRLQQIGNQSAQLTNPGRSPLAMGLMQGAQTGANYGQQAAQGASGFGQSLYPQAQGLMGGANQIMNLGMDPQSALYARTLQQTQDQARVAQAARGVAMSPYGAGLENQATRNFNIDWQNQLLNRATQAGQAAAGMDQTAAGLGSSAFNLGSGASQLAQSAGQMPYQAAQGLLQNKANALAGVGPQIQQANQPAQQVISDYLQLLGMGPAYQQAGNQMPIAGMQSGLQAGLGLIGK